MWGGKILVVRPMSRTRLSLPSRTGMMSASQAILRMAVGCRGPWNVDAPVLSRGVAVVGVVVFDAVEAFEQVLVVDGHHDLGAEAAVGRQFAGGQGHRAGADESVEEFLGAGAAVQGGECVP